MQSGMTKPDWLGELHNQLHLLQNDLDSNPLARERRAQRLLLFFNNMYLGQPPFETWPGLAQDLHAVLVVYSHDAMDTG